MQRGGITKSNVGVRKCQSHGIRFKRQVFVGRRENGLRSELGRVYKGSESLAEATLSIGTSIYQTVGEEGKKAEHAGQ